MDKKEILTFTLKSDLTEDEIKETQATYLKHAQNYAHFVERVPDASTRIQAKTIFPFLNQYESLGLTKPILFVGAGTGRDMETSEKLGFDVVGIDTSVEMIALAKSYGVKSPYLNMDMRRIGLTKNSFHGIFCESAISHIKKTEAVPVLEHFFQLLSPGGILMLGIRVGTGHVYVLDDQVGGKRYNTTMTPEESSNLISKIGFDILFSPEYQVVDRPNMIDYILKKPI